MRLLAITAELHVCDGVVNWGQPLRLGLSIEGRDFLRICEQRGDSIRFDDRPLEAADLGEGGRVEEHDVTGRLDTGLPGSEVEAVRAIHEGSGRPLGMALETGGGATFCIWANDDEFYWGDAAALGAATLPDGIRSVIGERI